MTDSVIYMKIEQNIIVNDTNVSLRQISKLQGTNQELIQQLMNLNILQITQKKKKKYVMSVMTVIEQIQSRFPEVFIINLGETEFVVSYDPPHPRRKVWYIIKVVFVSVAVFFGSAFTIMTFDNDVGVNDVFALFNRLVLGTETPRYPVVQIAYSVGLPLGIMVFFNHFSKKRMQADPTPLQVQLRLYEENENKAIIENASRDGEEL